MRTITSIPLALALTTLGGSAVVECLPHLTFGQAYASPIRPGTVSERATGDGQGGLWVTSSIAPGDVGLTDEGATFLKTELSPLDGGPKLYANAAEAPARTDLVFKAPLTAANGRYRAIIRLFHAETGTWENFPVRAVLTVDADGTSWSPIAQSDTTDNEARLRLSVDHQGKRWTHVVISHRDTTFKVYADTQAVIRLVNLDTRKVAPRQNLEFTGVEQSWFVGPLFDENGKTVIYGDPTTPDPTGFAYTRSFNWHSNIDGSRLATRTDGSTFNTPSSDMGVARVVAGTAPSGNGTVTFYTQSRTASIDAIGINITKSDPEVPLSAILEETEASERHFTVPVQFDGVATDATFAINLSAVNNSGNVVHEFPGLLTKARSYKPSDRLLESTDFRDGYGDVALYQTGFNEWELKVWYADLDSRDITSFTAKIAPSDTGISATTPLVELELQNEWRAWSAEASTPISPDEEAVVEIVPELPSPQNALGAATTAYEQDKVLFVDQASPDDVDVFIQALASGTGTKIRRLKAARRRARV